MSVRLLIITHGNIGQSLFDTAVSILGGSPLPTEIFSIALNCEPDSTLEQIRTTLSDTEQSDGVLVLTDLYGATPSNIACELANKNINVVAGLNLPMLIRVLNYPALSLSELTEKAISGGQDGVVPCHCGKKS